MLSTAPGMSAEVRMTEPGVFELASAVIARISLFTHAVLLIFPLRILLTGAWTLVLRYVR